MKMLKPTFRDLMWLAVIVAILILWKQCGKKSPSQSLEVEKAKKAVLDSAIKEFVVFKDSLEKVIVNREWAMNELAIRVNTLTESNDAAYAELAKAQKPVDSLSVKVIDQRGKIDTTCLQLANKYNDLSGKLTIKEKVNGELLNDLRLLSSTKDSIISDERRIKNAALKQGLEATKAYSDLFATFKKEQPRNALLIGPEASWSPWTQTVGGVIALQNKKGTQYQFGVGLDAHNIGYYFKVGIIYKISLRKK